MADQLCDEQWIYVLSFQKKITCYKLHTIQPEQLILIRELVNRLIGELQTFTSYYNRELTTENYKPVLTNKRSTWNIKYHEQMFYN